MSAVPTATVVLQQLDEEVGPVLELGQRPELEVQPREAERPQHQLPTAE